nr:hypothetical protein BaRGS_031868 [Batillaria attramentaria]
MYMYLRPEVVLHRSSSDEKLGLTLCYGSLEDEVTDIFISEDTASIGRQGQQKDMGCSLNVASTSASVVTGGASEGRRDGRFVAGVWRVPHFQRSRDEAIALFSCQEPDISLLVARPQLQIDDGFMDEPNLVLEDLHMDLLEKHHQDNMHFMASMLARVRALQMTICWSE